MRSRTVFSCQQCAYQAAKWLGRCPECGTWGSLVEERLGEVPRRAVGVNAPVPALPYPEVPLADAERTATGLGELDRVLGGGLVRGVVVLLGGEPGIGKSTLLLQAASQLAAARRPVLYVTGEESAAQLRLRGERLGVQAPELWVLAETDVDRIVEAGRRLGPALLVVDSAQAVRCPDLSSLPGSVAQVRESAGRLVSFAKANGVPVILVGHVTKDGALAGPRALEHVVDTVLSFEGQSHHAHRVLRTLKNRFGPTGELGVLAMEDRGLAGVPSPSEFFLSERPVGQPGSCVCAAVEGSRPLMVEIQALVGEAVPASARRTALGVDAGRLAMILAVLARQAETETAGRDVFVNVAGGIQVIEPAADLAIAVALLSSAAGQPVDPSWAVAGEIGLAGEIRSISRVGDRLREAARLGFRRALIPAAARDIAGPKQLELVPVRQVDEVRALLLGRAGPVRSDNRRLGGRASAPDAPTGA